MRPICSSPPPRPLSPAVVANLLSDHVFDRPLKAFLDPLIIAGIIILVVLFALRANTAIRLVPVLLIVFRLLISAWHFFGGMSTTIWRCCAMA